MVTKLVAIVALIGAFGGIDGRRDCDVNTQFHIVDEATFNRNVLYDLKAFKDAPAKDKIELTNGDLDGTLCIEFLQHFAGVSSLAIVDFGIRRFEKRSFQRFANLLTVRISKNHVQEIGEGVFDNEKLSTLILQRNGIRVIADGAFKALPNLQLLDLSFNMIAAIDPVWFKYTPVLAEIIFDYNRMEALKNETFALLPLGNTCTEKGVKCPSISVAHNQIQYLEFDVFKGLKNLYKLNLEYNDIYELPYFKTMIDIDSINLQYNNIEDADDFNLQMYASTKKVYLYGNQMTPRSIENIEGFNKEHGKRIYYEYDYETVQARNL